MVHQYIGLIDPQYQKEIQQASTFIKKFASVGMPISVEEHRRYIVDTIYPSLSKAQNGIISIETDTIAKLQADWERNVISLASFRYAQTQTKADKMVNGDIAGNQRYIISVLNQMNQAIDFNLWKGVYGGTYEKESSKHAISGYSAMQVADLVDTVAEYMDKMVSQFGGGLITILIPTNRFNGLSTTSGGEIPFAYDMFMKAINNRAVGMGANVIFRAISEMNDPTDNKKGMIYLVHRQATKEYYGFDASVLERKLGGGNTDSEITPNTIVFGITTRFLVAQKSPMVNSIARIGEVSTPLSISLLKGGKGKGKKDIIEEAK